MCEPMVSARGREAPRPSRTVEIVPNPTAAGNATASPLGAPGCPRGFRCHCLDVRVRRKAAKTQRSAKMFRNPIGPRPHVREPPSVCSQAFSRATILLIHSSRVLAALRLCVRESERWHSPPWARADLSADQHSRIFRVRPKSRYISPKLAIKAECTLRTLEEVQAVSTWDTSRAVEANLSDACGGLSGGGDAGAELL